MLRNSSTRGLRRLIQLYEKMARLTFSHCQGQCVRTSIEHPERKPFWCCQPTMCENALEYAKEYYGVEIQQVPGQILATEKGCPLKPHQRPLCTVHQCSIASIGMDPKNVPWTKGYYALRHQICMAEEGMEKTKETTE